jgi:hypothetical protein
VGHRARSAAPARARPAPGFVGARTRVCSCAPRRAAPPRPATGPKALPAPHLLLWQLELRPQVADAPCLHETLVCARLGAQHKGLQQVFRLPTRAGTRWRTLGQGWAWSGVACHRGLMLLLPAGAVVVVVLAHGADRRRRPNDATLTCAHAPPHRPAVDTKHPHLERTAHEAAFASSPAAPFIVMRLGRHRFWPARWGEWCARRAPAPRHGCDGWVLQPHFRDGGTGGWRGRSAGSVCHRTGAGAPLDKRNPANATCCHGNNTRRAGAAKAGAGAASRPLPCRPKSGAMPPVCKFLQSGTPFCSRRDQQPWRW